MINNRWVPFTTFISSKWQGWQWLTKDAIATEKKYINVDVYKHVIETGPDVISIAMIISVTKVKRELKNK